MSGWMVSCSGFPPHFLMRYHNEKNERGCAYSPLGQFIATQKCDCLFSSLSEYLWSNWTSWSSLFIAITSCLARLLELLDRLALQEGEDNKERSFQMTIRKLSFPSPSVGYYPRTSVGCNIELDVRSALLPSPSYLTKHASFLLEYWFTLPTKCVRVEVWRYQYVYW